METVGKTITCRAAICWGPKQPLTVESVEVQPPKDKEVRVKIISTAACHTDAHLVTGHVTAGFTVKYPVILGHEAAGIVESVGEGVTSVAPGDHVLTIFMPQCNDCAYCREDKTNFCLNQAIDASVIPAGGPRIAFNGQPVYQLAGIGSFSQYSVIFETQVAKINPKAPLDKVCLLSCGITTGYGAVVKLAKLKPKSTVGVWGLGTIGLATAMAAKMQGATKIIGVDINPTKFDLGTKFGCTDFVNPNDCKGHSTEATIKELTGGRGVDYAFECIGLTSVAVDAMNSTATGWGVTVLLGIFSGADDIKISPVDFSYGKTVTGGLFGGYKGRNEVNQLVELYLDGKLALDDFITGTGDIEDSNKAFDDLIAGQGLRTVLLLHENASNEFASDQIR